MLRLRGDVSLAGPSGAAQALEIAAGAALIVAGGAAGRGWGHWLLPAAGAAWLAAEWDNPAAPGAAAFTVGLIAVQVSLPLVLASRWRRSFVAAPLAILLASAVLFALAGAVSSGPLAAAAASPRAVGCTDCPRDLIALADDAGLNAQLTRLGAQLSVAAGLTAVVWLAACLVAARRRRPMASADLAADAAATGFAAAVAAGAAATLTGGSADSLTYGWRAAASGMLLVLSAAVAVPALRRPGPSAWSPGPRWPWGAIRAGAPSTRSPARSMTRPCGWRTRRRMEPGATVMASSLSCPSRT